MRQHEPLARGGRNVSYPTTQCAHSLPTVCPTTNIGRERVTVDRRPRVPPGTQTEPRTLKLRLLLLLVLNRALPTSFDRQVDYLAALARIHRSEFKRQRRRVFKVGFLASAVAVAPRRLPGLLLTTPKEHFAAGSICYFYSPNPPQPTHPPTCRRYILAYLLPLLVVLVVSGKDNGARNPRITLGRPVAYSAAP